MESGLSMQARYEIARKFAQQYAIAAKKDTGKLLDEEGVRWFVGNIMGNNRSH
jgi:hypothetical protein